MIKKLGSVDVENRHPVQRKPVIAIINAHWLVHSSVAYMSASLEKSGYDVHVYLYCSDERFSGDLLKNSTAITIKRFGNSSIGNCGPSPGGAVSVSTRIWQLFKHVFPISVLSMLREIHGLIMFKLARDTDLMPCEVIQSIVKACRDTPYLALIGVEKGGIGLAGVVAEKTATPLIYFSLELYGWDHEMVKGSIRMKRLKRIEERYHRSCVATIVQDSHRGRALLEHNHVSFSMKMIYLPISLSGKPNKQNSNWLVNELSLHPKTVILISYGMLAEHRLCVEMVTVAQRFPENWRLVFHGFGSDALLSKMRNADTNSKICLSLRMVPAHERESIIRSATIGLAFYSNFPLNDSLTGFSSEKIALYLKCGLPLIAFRRSSYEHIESEGAGVLVECLSEVPNAIAQILYDYEAYRERAYNCFLKHYDFERSFNKALSFLDTLKS